MKALRKLFTIHYLPLLLVALPQAYAVGLWLWLGAGYAELNSTAAWSALVMAIIGAAGYEAIYVGAIGWAEQSAATRWTWATAITAWLFSVAVAVYVYRDQGAAALLHAGFPTVAFFYTVTMHHAALRRPSVVEVDPTTQLATAVTTLVGEVKLLATRPALTDAAQTHATALPRQESYPEPERAYVCATCGATLNRYQYAASKRRGRCAQCPSDAI